VGGKPVRIGMVTDELEKLFIKDNKNEPKLSNIYNSFSEDAWRNLSKGNADKILEEAKFIVSRYFYLVQMNFNDDWNSKKSLMFTSKYFGAFCRLLVEFKRLNLDEAQIDTKLKELKTNIVKEMKAIPRPLVFMKSKQDIGVPQVGGTNSASLPIIYEWLKKHISI